MSTTLTLGQMVSCTITNKSGQVKRVSPRPTDDATLSSREYFNRLTIPEVAALLTSATLHKALPIDHLMEARQPYIGQRNQILDSPLKYFNPFYRKQLKVIDAKLDDLDIQINQLDNNGREDERNLKTIIEKAEIRLAECFKALKG